MRHLILFAAALVQADAAVVVNGEFTFLSDTTRAELKTVLATCFTGLVDPDTNQKDQTCVDRVAADITFANDADLNHVDHLDDLRNAFMEHFACEDSGPYPLPTCALDPEYPGNDGTCACDIPDMNELILKFTRIEFTLSSEWVNKSFAKQQGQNSDMMTGGVENLGAPQVYDYSIASFEGTNSQQECNPVASDTGPDLPPADNDPTNQWWDTESNKGLSGGAIAGITIGALAGAAIVGYGTKVAMDRGEENRRRQGKLPYKEPGTAEMTVGSARPNV